MSKEEIYLLDDELDLSESKEQIENQFEELIDEQEENIKEKKKTKFDAGEFLKMGTSMFESIGEASEKLGLTADKIGNATDKIGKTAVKVGKSISNVSSDVFETVKNVDVSEIGKNIKAGTGKTIEVLSAKSKELIDGASNVITPEQMQSILDSCYDKSVNGIPGVSKTIDQLANDYLSKYDDPNLAAKALINNQLVKCTTSGFLTSLGGLITLPMALPANIASVLYVQMRMIAALAYIGGFDPSNDQVQTLVYACLTGQAIGDVLKITGVKLGNKLALSGVQKISGSTLTKINQKVGFRLITKFGEKGIINIGKAIPVVGGVVGGGFDFVSTKVIAKNAYNAFVLKKL